MKLMASYRVCNGKVPGRPVVYRLPDPCLYGHKLEFIAEIITPAPTGEGDCIATIVKISVEQPTALWLCMSAALEEFHTELDEHTDWVEYRWKMFSSRGEPKGA